MNNDSPNSSLNSSFNKSSGFQKQVQSFQSKLKEITETQVCDEFHKILKDLKKSKTVGFGYSLEVRDKIDKFIKKWKRTFKNLRKNIPEDLEEIEAIICAFNYNKLFECCKEEEKTKKLQDNLEQLKDATPRALELPVDIIINATLEQIKKQMNAIRKSKTPKLKLNRIVNVCKLVSGMIWGKSKDSAIPAGADEFLPLLIYVIIKCQPQEIYTDVNFIKVLRHHDLMSGLADYYLTSFESAISHLETTDPKVLLKKSEDSVESSISHHEMTDPRDLLQESEEPLREDKQPVIDESIKDLSINDSVDLLEISTKSSETKKVIENSFSISENSPKIKKSGLFDDKPSALLELKEIEKSLYSHQQKFIKFEGKTGDEIFVSDIKSLIYEYNTMMKHYKKVSEKVSSLLDSQ